MKTKQSWGDFLPFRQFSLDHFCLSRVQVSIYLLHGVSGFSFSFQFPTVIPLPPLCPASICCLTLIIEAVSPLFSFPRMLNLKPRVIVFTESYNTWNDIRQNQLGKCVHYQNTLEHHKTGAEQKDPGKKLAMSTKDSTSRKGRWKGAFECCGRSTTASKWVDGDLVVGFNTIFLFRCSWTTL